MKWYHSILSADILLHENIPDLRLIEKVIKNEGHEHDDQGNIYDHLLPWDTDEISLSIVAHDTLNQQDPKKHKIINIDAYEFEQRKIEYLRKLHLLKPELYLDQREMIDDEQFNWGINLISTSASWNLGLRYLTLPLIELEEVNQYTFYVDPHWGMENEIPDDQKKYLAINFETREVLILGVKSLKDSQRIMRVISAHRAISSGVLPLESRLITGEYGRVLIFNCEHEKHLIHDELYGVGTLGLFSLQKKTMAFASMKVPQMRDGLFQTMGYEKAAGIFVGRHLPEQESDQLPFPGNIIILTQAPLDIFPEVSSLDFNLGAFYLFLGPSVKEINLGHDLELEINLFCGDEWRIQSLRSLYGLLMKYFEFYRPMIWMVNTRFFPHFKEEDLQFVLNKIHHQSSSTHSYLKDDVFGFFVPKTPQKESVQINHRKLEIQHSLQKMFFEFIKDGDDAFYNKKNFSRNGFISIE